MIDGQRGREVEAQDALDEAHRERDADQGTQRPVELMQDVRQVKAATNLVL